MKHWSVVPSRALALATCAVLWSPRAHAGDPTNADCVAANEAALKAGNEHRLRADRNQLLVCASATCPTDIRMECVRRVGEVNAAIPTIIFDVKDAAGNDLTAVKVTMDQEVLAERVEGIALSIDPGEHNFVFETAGQPTLTKRFVIREAQKGRRETIRFGTPTTAPSLTLTQQPTGAQSPPDNPPVTLARQGLGTQKILALVVGGIGVVGLGVGTAAGVLALSQKSDAQGLCPSTSCPTQAGVNKWSDAASTGNVSTIGLIVGGVTLAGGAVLWFTGPSSSRGSTTQVGFGPGFLQVRGTW